MWWLLATALAAPPDYTHRGEQHGCDLFLGPTEADGRVIPMWAECHWPHVSFEAISEALDDPSRLRDFRDVVDVQVLDSDERFNRVWQLHAVPLVADREVAVDIVRTDRARGSVWSWSVTEDVALPLDAANVACPFWSGSWTVEPDGDGVRVTLVNRYHHGEFPAWLVRPFLTGKLAETLADLEAVTH